MTYHFVDPPNSTRKSRRDFLCRATAAGVFALATLALPWNAAAETRTVDVAIKQGKVAGANSVRVTQGDAVILRWTSDRPMALHLHGYDIEVAVGPGAPAEMTIDARATGRFAVEAHTHGESKGGHGHQALFHLEVYPK